MANRKKKKKTKPRHLIEYGIVYLLILATQSLPFAAVRALGTFLGKLAFRLGSRRRNIALDNLHHAFGDSKSPAELERIARDSFISFFMTFLESIKFRKRKSLFIKHLVTFATSENTARLLQYPFTTTTNHRVNPDTQTWPI